MTRNKKTTFGRKRQVRNLLFVLFLLMPLISIGVQNAHAISDELMAKKNLLAAKKYYQDEDFAKASVYFEKLTHGNAPVPDEFYFFYGKSLIKTKKFDEGLSKLQKYIEVTQEQGKYVMESLELMTEVEKPEGMVFVKGGCFQMGDTFGDGGEDEKPVHEVCVDDFSLDKYEVTQREFSQKMGNNPSEFKGCDNCPVEQVTCGSIPDIIASQWASDFPRRRNGSMQRGKGEEG